jgi:hypothetical protein
MLLLSAFGSPCFAFQWKFLEALQNAASGFLKRLRGFFKFVNAWTGSIERIPRSLLWG